MAKLIFEKKEPQIDLQATILSLKESEMIIIPDSQCNFSSLPTRIAQFRRKGILDGRKIVVLRDTTNKDSYVVRFKGNNHQRSGIGVD